MENVVVSVEGLCKSYGGVHALRDVSLNLRAGEIHALCGENGAGKSTLIRCLAGTTTPDAGTLKVHHVPLSWGSVQRAESAGIAVIHQESTTFPDLSAIDNLFVGRAPCRWHGWLLNRPQMRQQAEEVLSRLKISMELDRPLAELPIAQRQLVAIGRALLQDCRLLIMDEPTASLSSRETHTLLELCRRLREDGVTILYVSHRLEEVFALADRITVLRDGEHVATRAKEAVDHEGLIQLMVGRSVPASQKRPPRTRQDERLRVSELCGRGFQNVSFSIQAGEVLGLGGLVGAGRSEVARGVFGIEPYHSGRVLVDGKSLSRGNVQQALRMGIAMVPEDRQHEGLVLPMTVAENLTLTILRQLTRWGLVQKKAEAKLVSELITDLQVRTAEPQAAAENLSGGNQQKVVIAKWLARRPRVLILDEPTRGVDVGAKAQVHTLIHQLSMEGLATLVISSEIAELGVLCDRILVMAEGQVRGEVPGSATPEEVLALALPRGSETVGGRSG